jgi:hypothetical protein
LRLRTDSRLIPVALNAKSTIQLPNRHSHQLQRLNVTINRAPVNTTIIGQFYRTKPIRVLYSLCSMRRSRAAFDCVRDSNIRTKHVLRTTQESRTRKGCGTRRLEN